MRTLHNSSSSLGLQLANIRIQRTPWGCRYITTTIMPRCFRTLRLSNHEIVSLASPKLEEQHLCSKVFLFQQAHKIVLVAEMQGVLVEAEAVLKLLRIVRSGIYILQSETIINRNSKRMGALSLKMGLLQQTVPQEPRND